MKTLGWTYNQIENSFFLQTGIRLCNQQSITRSLRATALGYHWDPRCTGGRPSYLSKCDESLLVQILRDSASELESTPKWMIQNLAHEVKISKPDSDHWYVLQHDAKSCTFYVVVSKNTANDQRTSQLTISLDGLPDGEEKSLVIGIVQYAGGTNLDVEVDGWGDEQDWSAYSELNGHEWIDLGLSSGLKWATCNVGATKPEEYGGYYAWGETEEKSNYDWETYKWCNGSSTTMTKYCTDSDYGTVDNKRVLDPSDDVAHVKWGGSWRMPTLDEIKELVIKCNWQWTSLNGVDGYRVTGPNGNSIFLPAAGYRYGTELYLRGANGLYWSSSLSDNYCYSAYGLLFNVGNYGWYYDFYRNHGRSVRPVSK